MEPPFLFNRRLNSDDSDISDYLIFPFCKLIWDISIYSYSHFLKIKSYE